MSKFFNEKLNGLVPYTPGEQPTGRKYIKLNTNESPFPPSPNAVMMASMASGDCQLYPDPDCLVLVKAIAQTYGVESENVIVTNGSDEVLNFAFMAYCGEKKAIFPDLTYGFYSVFATLYGVKYCEKPLKEDFTIDINDYILDDGTVFIANPNAPTGIALEIDDIEKIVSSNPDRIVVIDEAYVDFGGESAIPLIKKYKNLLITQTFSKSRSMAGARLGFGIADKEIISDLNRIRYSTNPYNVNRMTLMAGVGAITDGEYFRTNCEQVVLNREYTTAELKKLGFELTPSKANFVFAKKKGLDGEKTYLKLKEKGILVRHFNKPRIKDYLRITIGAKEEMTALIKALKEIIEEK